MSVEEMGRKTQGWMDKCLNNAISTLIFNQEGTACEEAAIRATHNYRVSRISQVRLMDARCAFNEPYRYASRSEMTLVSALECPHVARAFLVSKMKRVLLKLKLSCQPRHDRARFKTF